MQLNARNSAAVLVLACTILAAPASARDSAAGRYTMHPADDGFLRLDTMTGAVSHCQKDSDKWKCQPMDGAQSSDRNEIARLEKQNSGLKGEIKRLEEMIGLKGPGDGKRADPLRPGGQKHSFRLPSEKEVDQALNYFEKMLRKFQDRLKRLEREQGTETKPL